MSICEQYQLDARCASDVRSGEIGEGCISCRFCDSFGRCRVSNRGRDAGDGRTYISLSGRRETLETDEDA